MQKLMVFPAVFICLSAYVMGETEYDLIQPLEGSLPLKIFDLPVGQMKSIDYEINELTPKDVMYLFLTIQDVDELREIKVVLNEQQLDVPASIIDATDDSHAFLKVDNKLFHKGKNILKFYFMDNINNTTRGYCVKKAEFYRAVFSDEEVLRKMLFKRVKNAKRFNLYNVEKEKYWTYIDDFEDEAIQGRPSHWMVLDRPGIVNSDSNAANHVLELNGLAGKSHTTLHVFSSTVNFKSKVKVMDSRKGGAVWLAIRYNLDDNYVVKAGYDFSSSQWMILDYKQQRKTVCCKKEGGLYSGIWYDWQVIADKMSVKFIVNGSIVCQSDSVYNMNYGKVGLYAQDCRVFFDDISYHGTGRPQDGVTLSYISGFGNGDMLGLDNGDLVMQYCGEYRFMRSTDGGRTWTPDMIFVSAKNGWGQCGNIWKLNSGKILHVFQNLLSKHPDFLLQAGCEISNDNGKTWTQGGWIHPQPGPYCTMNGKITQLFSGDRIFFPSGTGGEGLEAEKAGGIGIWYSDDEGQTWTESENRLDKNTTGYNLQEGEIVELSDGKLILLARSGTGYLMYSESTDGGVTWSTDIQSTGIASTMCAFNTIYDPKTKEVFLFWTYDDTTENPSVAQAPRQRVSLARSRDDMRSWEFLTDIDDFEGNTFRFMNLGIYADKDCIYTMVNVFGTGIGKSRAALQVTGIERGKLKPYDEFPTLH